MHGISRSFHWGLVHGGYLTSGTAGQQEQARSLVPTQGAQAEKAAVRGRRRVSREGAGSAVSRPRRQEQHGVARARRRVGRPCGRTEPTMPWVAQRPGRRLPAAGPRQCLPRLDGDAAAAWQRPLSDSVPAELAPFGARPKSDAGRRWSGRVCASTVVMPKQAETLQSPPPEGSTRRPLAGPPPREAASRSGCIPDYRPDNISPC